MSLTLITLTSLAYVWVAFESYFINNNAGLGVMYFGYAIGGLGSYILVKNAV